MQWINLVIVEITGSHSHEDGDWCFLSPFLISYLSLIWKVWKENFVAECITAVFKTFCYNGLLLNYLSLLFLPVSGEGILIKPYCVSLLKFCSAIKTNKQTWEVLSCILCPHGWLLHNRTGWSESFHYQCNWGNKARGSIKLLHRPLLFPGRHEFSWYFCISLTNLLALHFAMKFFLFPFYNLYVIYYSTQIRKIITFASASLLPLDSCTE